MRSSVGQVVRSATWHSRWWQGVTQAIASVTYTTANCHLTSANFF